MVTFYTEATKISRLNVTSSEVFSRIRQSSFKASAVHYSDRINKSIVVAFIVLVSFIAATKMFCKDKNITLFESTNVIELAHTTVVNKIAL